MARLSFCSMVVIMSLVSGLQAQERPSNRNNDAPSAANVSPSLNPELWLYLQQEQRHDDPKQAVRRKAEFRAAQRQARIATRKWFGYSNQRPLASTVPFMGIYSPMWGGTRSDPFHWVGGGHSTTAIYIEHDHIR